MRLSFDQNIRNKAYKKGNSHKPQSLGFIAFAPAVPEAVVLHALDMADGAVYKFNEVYKTLPEGCLSEKKISQLNNQYVYRAHPAYDETTVEMFTDWNEVW